MANNLRKFQNEAEYSAATLNYPAVSWVINGEVHFDKTAPETFGGLTVKYYIENPTVEVLLFNGGGGSSTSESSSESGSGGGGGALPTRMIVDGNEETPISTWRFETAGEHIVQYEFADDIVPSNFLVQTLATEAIIGDDITEIGNESFNCTSLTSVTIGTGITSIGDTAFYDYGNLASITIEATTPPTLGNYSLSGDFPIYVPAESVNAYKTEIVWLDYASRIEAIQ